MRANTSALLIVTAPHFTAAAIWRKADNGQWQCCLAAPILKWMVGMGTEEVKAYLIKKRWQFIWEKFQKQ